MKKLIIAAVLFCAPAWAGELKFTEDELTISTATSDDLFITPTTISHMVVDCPTGTTFEGVFDLKGSDIQSKILDGEWINMKFRCAPVERKEEK